MARTGEFFRRNQVPANHNDVVEGSLLEFADRISDRLGVLRQPSRILGRARTHIAWRLRFCWLGHNTGVLQRPLDWVRPTPVTWAASLSQHSTLAVAAASVVVCWDLASRRGADAVGEGTADRRVVALNDQGMRMFGGGGRCRDRTCDLPGVNGALYR